MYSQVFRSCLVIFLFVAVTSGQAFAGSTDGTAGATSTGTEEMDLDIPNLAKISGINDIAFGTYTGPGSAVLDDDVCIYSNAGHYKVTVKGSGSSSAFTVANGTQTIPYTVKWNDGAGTAGNAAVTANVQAGPFVHSSSTAVDCGGGSNGNFQVTITQAALLAAPAGTYTGVLTIIIDPN